jgi:hypothetical protein
LATEIVTSHVLVKRGQTQKVTGNKKSSAVGNRWFPTAELSLIIPGSALENPHCLRDHMLWGILAAIGAHKLDQPFKLSKLCPRRRVGVDTRAQLCSLGGGDPPLG